MESPNKGKESENLAERLRSLYQVYDCEHELPAHDDLVAKLSNVKSEVREATKMELDRDYVHPLSYEKALQEANIPLSEKVKMLYAFTLGGAVTYASQKWEGKKEREEGLLYWCAFLGGGLKTFPSVVKEVFLKPKEEIAKALMEEHNIMAARYFEGFKRNVEYYVLSEPFERNQSNSKNKVQN